MSLHLYRTLLQKSCQNHIFFVKSPRFLFRAQANYPWTLLPDLRYTQRNTVSTQSATQVKPETHEPTISYLDISPDLVVPDETKKHQRTSGPHKITLRAYQDECIKECLDSFSAGKKRIAVSLATGSGKTVIFSHLLAQVQPQPGQGNSVLILVHRRELATQARDTVQKFHPHLKVEIEMGKSTASLDADVIIASVPTLSTTRSTTTPRLQSPHFDPSRFKLIIVDEAHHAVAPTYLKIFKHFGADSPDTKVYLAGFSATLSRLDGLSLGKAMDHIVYHRDMMEMIKDGFLSDLRLTSIKATYDLQPLLDQEDAKWQQHEHQRIARLMEKPGESATMIKERPNKPPAKRGDYSSGMLSKILNTEDINDLVVKLWKKSCAAYKSTLIFCVDIKHAADLTRKFRDYNVGSEYISAKTPDTERSEIIQNFKDGNVPVLLNCAILTEGTDIPNIDSIILIRPTRSKSLLMQMIGRGLRLHPGKKHCHIFDFVGVTSSQKSGMLTLPSLAGLDPDTLVDNVSLKEMHDLEEEKILKEKRDEARKLREKEQEMFSGMRGVNIENVELQTFEGILDFFSIEEQKNNSARRESDRLKVFTSSYAWIPVDSNTYTLQAKGRSLSLISESAPTPKKKSKTTKNIEALELEEEKPKNTWRLEKNLLVDEYEYVRFKVQQLQANHDKPDKILGKHFTKSKKFENESGESAGEGIYTIKETVAEGLESEMALSAADTFAGSFFPVPYMVQRRAKWRQQPASSKQIDLIKKLMQRTLKTKEVTSLHSKFLQEKGSGATDTADIKSPLEDNLTWVDNITKGEAAGLLAKAKGGGLKKSLRKYYDSLGTVWNYKMDKIL